MPRYASSFSSSRSTQAAATSVTTHPVSQAATAARTTQSRRSRSKLARAEKWPEGALVVRAGVRAVDRRARLAVDEEHDCREREDAKAGRHAEGLVDVHP